MKLFWPWAVLLLAAGCVSPTAPTLRAQLESARARWATSGGASYTFELTRNCECLLAAQPVSVTVVSGQVVVAEYAGSKQPVEAELLANVLTVPDLFDMIAGALDRGAASLSASYDPLYGYPTSITVDYSATAVDDEISLTARDLRLEPALLQRP
jgi:Family of unknown function (DUF6174)